MNATRDTVRRRRAGGRGWLLVPVVLLAAGLWAVVTLPSAPPVEPLADLGLDPAAIAAAEAYAAPRRAWALVGWVVRLAVPLLWVALPAGRRVLRRVAGPRERSPWRAGLVAVVVLGTADLLLLPANAWLGHVREVEFGFRTAGLASWLRDWAVAVGLELGLAAVLVAALFAVLARRPGRWQGPVLAVGATLVVAGTALLPLVVTPLFLDAEPLGEGVVRDRVVRVVEDAEQALGRELGTPTVEVVDASRRTTRRNALVTGLGPTLRVQLFDTLVADELADDEARATLDAARATGGRAAAAEPAADDLELTAVIVAHELGHAVRADTLRAAALGAAALVPGVLLLDRLLVSRRVNRLVDSRSPTDPRLASVLVVAAVLVGALVTPMGLAVSRQVEHAADAFALEAGADPAAQAALHRSFVTRDLSPPDRPWWVMVLFSTHPTPAERIARAQDASAG